MTHENGRPVVPGCISYVDARRPTLMFRWGREDYSDAYDDYVDMVSHDNGRTWSEPVSHLKSYAVEGGRVRYGEPAWFFDADTGKVVALANRTFYPDDTLNVDAHHTVVTDAYDPSAARWTELAPLDLDYPGGVMISFCFPIETSRRRLVVPAQAHYLDAEGRPVHYKGCWAPAGVALPILGDYAPDGSIRWHLSRPVVPDLEKTSRGFYEPAIAELSDGRFAMILRGDNSMFPARPGYKWLAFSDDHCESWSEPAPLPCDEGEPIESGSNGSALFRSIKTGKLYWMGNLCIDGVRPRGNWPRTPLVVAEVQEHPFALRRGTLTVIDRQAPGEPAEVQHSNFRFYQDRDNGDVVLFLTRYGERSAKDWMLADTYRYRVAVE
jgi:hypothetical protein